MKQQQLPKTLYAKIDEYADGDAFLVSFRSLAEAATQVEEIIGEYKLVRRHKVRLKPVIKPQK